MVAIPPPTLFDEVLDFLTSAPSPQQIVEFAPSSELQFRASELLARNRQGQLTAEERVELDEFAHMNHFMSLLKIRARKKLIA